MIKTLLKSLREYTRATILTPVFVTGEVICEALIPFLIAMLVNDIKAGAGLNVIVGYAWKMLLLAFASLFCGWMAGIYC
ncbi:MAG: ABC transporter ATP-binding protein, partial [Erysipelotrichaceae bacterium]|nr:ABC transporter ATP-binding protein [Erysipelotrichaceae bacterium]